MDKFDKMITEALDADDRKLLEDFREPGFFGMLFGLFGGPIGWVAAVMAVVQTLMFLASVWAAWHFFNATEVLVALKWGLPAAVLVLVALQMKMALMSQLHADRVILALRRLEMRLFR